MYIRQLKVRNYRSLKDVSIGSLSPLVILYGNNDTGKSNILSFLEHVFRQKYVEELTTVGGEGTVQRRPGGFWRGEIENFSDNYYRESGGPITFFINIRFLRPEVRAACSRCEEFLSRLPAGKRFDHLVIEGNIGQSSADRAEMTLVKAEFNQTLFYDSSQSDVSRFLPGFSLDPTQARDVFDRIMGTLDNAFLRVPAARFLRSEGELDRSEKAALTPDSFKNWLFQSSISRDEEKLFRRVSDQFGAPPFEHGRISIGRLGEDEIEVFVEGGDGLKLPIGRKGTGVQQILMILSYVAQSSSPVIAIEELEINLSPASQTAVFDRLFRLVNTAGSGVSQVFLTTHSSHMARRNEAQRRGVTMENGQTTVKKASEAEVEDFFIFPYS